MIEPPERGDEKIVAYTLATFTTQSPRLRRTHSWLHPIRYEWPLTLQREVFATQILESGAPEQKIS